MTLKSVLSTLAAVILGELALVLLITFVQETLFGGVTWTHSPWRHILLGGFGTFLSAVIAGYLAWRVVGRRHRIPILILTFLITLEMTWLITAGKTPDPIWFDLMAGASLVVGIWLGSYLEAFSRISSGLSARQTV